MANKKVLILNWRCPKNPLSGGAEKVTLEHAKTWVKNGFCVTWISGNYIGGKKEEIINGVRIYRYGSPITIYFIAPIIYWLKFKGQFDLVIDEIHGIPFLIPLWAWKSNKLAYIHEVAQEIWNEMFPFPINLIGKLYEKLYFWFYKNTLFLTGSNSTKKDLIKFGINNKNIIVLAHGLFLKPVENLPNKEKNLTLLFVGRLVKMKGIEDALKIFKHIHDKVITSKFWIIGDGSKEYLKKLKKLTTDLEINRSTKFYGYVTEENKLRMYQKAHFLIHTSVREGFGLTVIEANSQGTPVLAYNNPGLWDIIKENINGYLFSKNRQKEMVKKCLSLYNSKQYNKLVKSSVDYSTKYNWLDITKRGALIISRLCSKNE